MHFSRAGIQRRDSNFMLRDQPLRLRFLRQIHPYFVSLRDISRMACIVFSFVSFQFARCCFSFLLAPMCADFTSKVDLIDRDWSSLRSHSIFRDSQSDFELVTIRDAAMTRARVSRSVPFSASIASKCPPCVKNHRQ